MRSCCSTRAEIQLQVYKQSVQLNCVCSEGQLHVPAAADRHRAVTLCLKGSEILQCKLVILIVLCGIPQVHSYYSDTYLLTYLITYILACLLAYLLIYFLTYLLTYILTYLLTFLLTYVLTYVHTYLLTFSLTYVLTYLLTPWSRVLLVKLTGFQLVKKFSAFYGIRMFITAFTTPCHVSLS